MKFRVGINIFFSSGVQRTSMKLMSLHLKAFFSLLLKCRKKKKREGDMEHSDKT